MCVREPTDEFSSDVPTDREKVPFLPPDGAAERRIDELLHVFYILLEIGVGVKVRHRRNGRCALALAQRRVFRPRCDLDLGEEERTTSRANDNTDVHSVTKDACRVQRSAVAGGSAARRCGAGRDTLQQIVMQFTAVPQTSHQTAALGTTS